jgi:hypothetical protein
MDAIAELKLALGNAQAALDAAWAHVETTTLRDLTDLDAISGALEDSLTATDVLAKKPAWLTSLERAVCPQCGHAHAHEWTLCENCGLGQRTMTAREYQITVDLTEEQLKAVVSLIGAAVPEASPRAALKHKALAKEHTMEAFKREYEVSGETTLGVRLLPEQYEQIGHDSERELCFALGAVVQDDASTLCWLAACAIQRALDLDEDDRRSSPRSSRASHETRKED